MKTIQFKTNIKCSGCIATVTPFLNTEGIEKWEVDLQSPDRILTVDTQKTPAEVAKLIQDAGYSATPTS
jgi:copper chaperone